MGLPETGAFVGCENICLWWDQNTTPSGSWFWLLSAYTARSAFVHFVAYTCQYNFCKKHESLSKTLQVIIEIRSSRKGYSSNVHRSSFILNFPTIAVSVGPSPESKLKPKLFRNTVQVDVWQYSRKANLSCQWETLKGPDVCDTLLIGLLRMSNDFLV